MKKKEKLKLALENYDDFLRRNCSKEELIRLVLETCEKKYPDETITLYLKK